MLKGKGLGGGGGCKKNMCDSEINKGKGCVCQMVTPYAGGGGFVSDNTKDLGPALSSEIKCVCTHTHL